MKDEEEKNSSGESTESPRPALDYDSRLRFTPGPWKVRAGTFCESDGIPSYEVVMPGKPTLNAVDARLIGAAPALYEALKEILNYGAEFDDPRLDYVVAHVDRDAIAAARVALSLVEEKQ